MGHGGWRELNYPTDRTGFPGGSDGKESACSVEDLGSVPGPLEEGMATHLTCRGLSSSL